MIPMEGDTDFRSSNSSGERLPGFKWGIRPVLQILFLQPLEIFCGGAVAHLAKRLAGCLIS